MATQMYGLWRTRDVRGVRMAAIRRLSTPGSTADGEQSVPRTPTSFAHERVEDTEQAQVPAKGQIKTHLNGRRMLFSQASKYLKLEEFILKLSEKCSNSYEDVNGFLDSYTQHFSQLIFSRFSLENALKYYHKYFSLNPELSKYFHLALVKAYIHQRDDGKKEDNFQYGWGGLFGGHPKTAKIAGAKELLQSIKDGTKLADNAANQQGTLGKIRASYERDMTRIASYSIEKASLPSAVSIEMVPLGSAVSQKCK